MRWLLMGTIVFLFPMLYFGSESIINYIDSSHGQKVSSDQPIFPDKSARALSAPVATPELSPIVLQKKLSKRKTHFRALRATPTSQPLAALRKIQTKPVKKNPYDAEEYTVAPETTKKAKKTDALDKRWIPALSGGHIDIRMGQRFKMPDDICDADCEASKKLGILVGGVVVDTNKTADEHPQLLLGQVQKGNGAKTPAIYIK